MVKESWKKVKVGNILVKLKRHKKLKKSQYLKKGKYLVIDQGKKFISGYTNNGAGLYRDVPITIFGDHTRILKFVKIPFVAGADGTQCLIPNERFNRRYFYYSLKNLKLKNYGYERHFKYLKDEGIYEPEIDEQQKIATILSNYDDLIENNTKRIELLEKIARLIYKEWFVKFRFPGYKKVKMVESELGIIPKMWEVKDLDEVIDKITEKYTDENNELPLLNLARIPRKSLSISEFGKSDEITTSRILFKQNDILFSAIRTYFHKVILAPIDGITNVSVFVLRPKNDEYLELIFCKLFAKETINWATQNSTGTKMPVLSWNIFRKMKLIIHDIKTIKMFKSNVQPVFKKITFLNKQNQVLRQTHDILLPKLMSGEIRIDV